MLEYVPKNIVTKNIIKIAVSNDPFALYFVHYDDMDDEILKIVASKNGFVFHNISLSEDKLTKEIIDMAYESKYRLIQDVKDGKIKRVRIG